MDVKLRDLLYNDATIAVVDTSDDKAALIDLIASSNYIRHHAPTIETVQSGRFIMIIPPIDNCFEKPHPPVVNDYTTSIDCSVLNSDAEIVTFYLSCLNGTQQFEPQENFIGATLIEQNVKEKFPNYKRFIEPWIKVGYEEKPILNINHEPASSFTKREILLYVLSTICKYNKAIYILTNWEEVLDDDDVKYLNAISSGTHVGIALLTTDDKYLDKKEVCNVVDLKEKK